MEIQRATGTFVKCEECDAFATFENAQKLGWDWFTGYLPRTHHWCRKHTGSKMHAATFTESRRERNPK